jgi:hypothetical protein
MNKPLQNNHPKIKVINNALITFTNQMYWYCEVVLVSAAPQIEQSDCVQIVYVLLMWVFFLQDSLTSLSTTK